MLIRSIAFVSIVFWRFQSSVRLTMMRPSSARISEKPAVGAERDCRCRHLVRERLGLRRRHVPDRDKSVPRRPCEVAALRIEGDISEIRAATAEGLRFI